MTAPNKASSESDSASETQIPQSPTCLVFSVVIAFDLLGGQRKTGLGPQQMWPMRNDSYCLARAKAHPPSLAGFKEFSTGRKEQRNCQQVLREASPLTIQAGEGCVCVGGVLPWQVLPWNSPEASASSTDRAADGTHLSADDILIYLSLTDGTMP